MLDTANSAESPTACTGERPAIHPGEHIADEFEKLNMSASRLTQELDIPASRLAENIRRRCGIADTALRLARWMGTSPQFWMNLQRNYALRLAEQEHGDEIRERVRPRSEAA
ncbi:MAG: HigA family addiction module antitoxin [Thermomicrobiales bacterium]